MCYKILLLFTDGVIHDIPMTKEILVELSYLPVSVIIIGMGADFQIKKRVNRIGSFAKLNKVISAGCGTNGKAYARDIIQFIEYNEAIKKGDLAAQVLKEIPKQVCSYMETIGFVPVAT